MSLQNTASPRFTGITPPQDHLKNPIISMTGAGIQQQVQRALQNWNQGEDTGSWQRIMQIGGIRVDKPLKPHENYLGPYGIILIGHIFSCKICRESTTYVFG